MSGTVNPFSGSPVRSSFQPAQASSEKGKEEDVATRSENEVEMVFATNRAVEEKSLLSAPRMVDRRWHSVADDEILKSHWDKLRAGIAPRMQPGESSSFEEKSLLSAPRMVDRRWYSVADDEILKSHWDKLRAGIAPRMQQVEPSSLEKVDLEFELDSELVD